MITPFPSLPGCFPDILGLLQGILLSHVLHFLHLARCYFVQEVEDELQGNQIETVKHFQILLPLYNTFNILQYTHNSRAPHIKKFSLAQLSKFHIFQYRVDDLEDNFVQIHLPNWQFYLPWAVVQWVMSSPEQTPHSLSMRARYSMSLVISVHIKTLRISIGIPIIKIRRSDDRLIFIMEIPIPGKTVFII